MNVAYALQDCAPAMLIIIIIIIIIIMMIIQFNSYLFVCNSTAQGPITKLARVNERKQTYTKYKTRQNNNYDLEVVIIILVLIMMMIIKFK
jgi:hypothetical protein